jgi:hypothetical protein
MCMCMRACVCVAETSSLEGGVDERADFRVEGLRFRV